MNHEEQKKKISGKMMSFSRIFFLSGQAQCALRVDVRRVELNNRKNHDNFVHFYLTFYV